MSYDMIDRYLRNNLHDDDYAEYSAALDAVIAAERERCITAVEAVPPHRWVDGSDQWGNPCPAKIVATRADYVAAIRGA